MTAAEWKALVGRRVLVKYRGYCSSQLLEATVQEVSPSGKRVRFKFTGNGEFSWEDIDEYEFQEVLNDL